MNIIFVGLKTLLRNFTYPQLALFCLLFCSPVSMYAATQVTATTGETTNSSATGSVSASEASAFGNHQSSASLGLLKASSSVVLSGFGSDGGVVTRATFEDDILCNVSGVPQFAAGTMTIAAEINGGPHYDQFATSGAVAQGMNVGYQFFMTRNGGTVYAIDGSILYGSSSDPKESNINTVPAPGHISIDIPIQFGTPSTIFAFLDARSGGNNNFFPPDDGSISGTTTVSFEWKGVTSIRDTVGNEYLELAECNSASGVDWFKSTQSRTVPLDWWTDLFYALILMGLASVVIYKNKSANT